jgi:NADP-dependent 3-hydroxy acid dehydrogenase YdfG
LQRLERAAESVGANALVVPADVSQPDSVRAAFAAVQSACGRLDLLVNNAAIARLHSLETAKDEDLEAQVATNFLGVLYCTRAAIPLLRASGGGVIVNLSSEGVRRPFPQLSVYLATKGAVEMLSTALKDELRPEGIRVTLLRSGGSTGGFVEEWDPEEAQRAIASWSEQGLLDFVGLPMAPESIAASVVYAATAPADASIDFLEIRSAKPMPRPSGDS